MGSSGATKIEQNSAATQWRSLLKKTKAGLIDNLRDTPIYSIYCQARDKQNIIAVLSRFYGGLIRDLNIPQELWFDVGANVGGRSTVYQHRPETRK